MFLEIVSAKSSANLFGCYIGDLYFPKLWVPAFIPDHGLHLSFIMFSDNNSQLTAQNYATHCVCFSTNSWFTLTATILSFCLPDLEAIQVNQTHFILASVHIVSKAEMQSTPSD